MRNYRLTLNIFKPIKYTLKSVVFGQNQILERLFYVLQYISVRLDVPSPPRHPSFPRVGSSVSFIIVFPTPKT